MITPLRIALTSDPDLPVPPPQYGGLERIVDLLARGLVARGHDVTVFAHADSKTAGKLEAWPGRHGMSKVDNFKNALFLAKSVARGRFDIIHSHSRLAYLLPVLPFGFPKLMTYHRKVTISSVSFAHTLSRKSLSFTAVSDWMTRSVCHVGKWDVVPNGVPVSHYTLRAEVAPNAPLVFLGRIEEIKGPHLAIEIARRTGRKLILAGNIPDEKRSWAEAYVLPHVDGDQIRYVGPVDDAQKNDLLGQAAAFLMPILWEEPFGIVMIEAMACGTPVLALRRGAVPDVVDHGETGFVADELDELIKFVARLPELSRSACRSAVEDRYSDGVVVERYLEVYREAIARRGRKAS